MDFPVQNKKLRRRPGSILGLLIALAASTALSGLPENNANQARPPNVVIILTDDQGYADVGKFGAKGFATPNLDRMASRGLMLRDFYVSQAVCSASRASLLTGCYAERVGIQGALTSWSTVGLNPDEETIAEMLKKKGYATGMVGKWHLGHYREFLPRQRGFDEYFGLPYSNDMWPMGYDGQPPAKGIRRSYPPLPIIEGDEKVGEVRTLEDQNTLTTLYTQRAVEFIEKNKNRSFFLYVAHSMPHVPLGVSEKFRGKSEQGRYGDVIMEIDWSVGEILQALERAGVDGNTLVIFTSDNGPWLNFGKHAGSAGPLREGKGTMWEGGARVPCIMRWPGRIPEGTESRSIAATIDLLPTIAAITGAPLPKNPIDGVNILPLLEGQKGAEPRGQYYFYYGGELKAVRMGKWKLHFPNSYVSYAGVEPGKNGFPGPYATGKSGLELYDLDSDIGETSNVADKYPEIVVRLQGLGNEARAELGDKLTGTKGRGVRPPGRAGGQGKGPVKNLAAGKKITLENRYSGQYAGRGDVTLIDGERGTLDHADGTWLGFETADLVALVDLGESLPVRQITAGFLEAQSAWIFLPSSVEIAISRDGKEFEVIQRVQTDTNSADAAPHVKDFPAVVSSSTPVRYIRVTARNIGTCPVWHQGAGGKAWLFADEIVVE